MRNSFRLPSQVDDHEEMCSPSDLESVGATTSLLPRPWHWRWGSVALSAYALASGAYIAAFMTPNASWEHHPFAGPLVALHESRHPAEFAVSLTIWFGLGMGLCWPTFRPTMPAILISVASVAVWIALGVWAASVAAC